MVQQSIIGKSRKPKNIKFHNQRLVLSLMRQREVISASEIAQKINLSVTTVVKILAVLQENGLIKSMGKGNSTDEGGKKPELFALNETFKHVVAAYVGLDFIQVTVMDLSCHVLADHVHHFTDGKNLERSMQDIADYVLQAVKECGLSPEDICAIPVSFDGIVDTQNGIIYYPIHNSSWGRDIPVLDLLRERLPWGKNVLVNNGCRYLSYGMFLEHPEYKEKNVLAILASDMTGGCFMEHGTMVEGAHGFMGEVGHVVVHPSYRKRRCMCGRYGCFENMVSTEALQDYAQELGECCGDNSLRGRVLKGEAGHQDIFQAADQGDPFARAVVDRLVEAFENLIHNAALLCDPDLIAIGGVYATPGDYFMGQLRRRIRSQSFFEIGDRLEITCLSMEKEMINTKVNVGAALYAVDEYLRTLEFI